MRMVKVETDDETRWVNLDQVVRATLARHVTSGAQILALYFASGLDETTLKIDGTTRKNAQAIAVLVAALDAAVVGS